MQSTTDRQDRPIRSMQAECLRPSGDPPKLQNAVHVQLREHWADDSLNAKDNFAFERMLSVPSTLKCSSLSRSAAPACATTLGRTYGASAPILDPTGDGTAIDIEARKRAEQALRKSEERWRSAFENSAIGVALTDLNGRFLAANHIYQAIVGYTEEELHALCFLDVTHEDYREANWALITELPIFTNPMSSRTCAVCSRLRSSRVTP